MHIIVCLDDRGGMLFNKRRQSKDSAIRRRILSGLDGRRLLMNAYSFRQFEGMDGVDAITVDEDFLAVSTAVDVCFVENADILPYASQIESVTVYKWNRAYPSSVKFPTELLYGKELVLTADFRGTSHDNITEEIYK